MTDDPWILGSTVCLQFTALHTEYTALKLPGHPQTAARV
jgi:hypothetical protein